MFSLVWELYTRVGSAVTAHRRHSLRTPVCCEASRVFEAMTTTVFVAAVPIFDPECFIFH